ncbi:MAG: hypothetical protein GY866_25135, partial [Proteobacteria bacterium]|nr:hypothetical protein [Pseudomonadota bacterium]
YYAIDYAFGAYLARNFGGVQLFRTIVQNGYTDYRAVEQALSDMGYDETFATVLQKFGVACLLSDNVSTTSGYIYNSGTFFTSALNGIDYYLGSINLFNYVPNPTSFSPSSLVNSLSGHYGSSNTYVKIGGNLTGTLLKEVEMPINVKLTVVVKDSD